MQFQYNSDYPGLDDQGQFSGAPAARPPPFPDAQPTPCARITTRVVHRNQVATVQNVLVRTQIRPPPQRNEDDDDDDIMSSSSSSSSSEEEAMAPEDTTNTNDSTEERAYWLQRTVREAIYGKVIMAVVLRKERGLWQVTDQHCAVKEMSWQHIRKERDRLAEDPIQEVAAMQYLKEWHAQQYASTNTDDSVQQSFATILQTNLMMPLDLLTDDRHLYSIMPYCDGGELFERLDMNEKFSEEEARYWMRQILNVSGVLLYLN